MKGVQNSDLRTLANISNNNLQKLFDVNYALTRNKNIGTTRYWMDHEQTEN